jgi:hypothetical protein
MFFIKILKNFIKSSLKMLISYKISMLLLGYCVLTPLLIRIFNTNILKTNNIADCAWNFSIGQAEKVVEPVFNGLTTGQITLSCFILLCGYYSINLLSEYALPPLLRSMGVNWYTLRELNLRALNNTDAIDIKRRLTNMENQIEIVNIKTEQILTNQVLLGQALDTILSRVDYARDAIVALIVGVQNTLSTINNENLNPIRAMMYNMQQTIDLISSTIQTQHENQLSPTALRAELERLLSVFTADHATITTGLQTVLQDFREQAQVAQSLDPSEFIQGNERLRNNIAALEGLLRQHTEVGTGIQQTVQHGIAAVTQLENTSTLITTVRQPNTDIAPITDIPTGPRIPSYNATDILVGVGAGAAAVSENNDTRVTNAITHTVDRTSQLIEERVVSSPTMGGQGSYSITQEGDQLILRLFNVKANFNIPVENMITNPMGTEIITHAKRAAGNFITDKLTSMVLNGALRVGAGALGGGLTGLGFSHQIINAILRNISPGAVSEVVIAEEKIETGLQVAKTFGKAAINLIFK